MEKHFWDGKKRRYRGWGRTAVTACGRQFDESDKMLNTQITTIEGFITCNTCKRILQQLDAKNGFTRTNREGYKQAKHAAADLTLLEGEKKRNSTS